MQKIRGTIVILILLAASVISGWAGPAWPGRLLLRQPDGSIVYAKLYGDEYFHLLRDDEGHLLVRDGDGYYCYAVFSAEGTSLSTGYYAGQPAPSHILAASRALPDYALGFAEAYSHSPLRTVPRTLLPLSPTGHSIVRPLDDDSQDSGNDGGSDNGDRNDDEVLTVHCPVILANFSDLELTYSREDFDAMLNGESYTSVMGETGSAASYFNDQFRGRVKFVFDVYEPVTVGGDRADYFGNLSTGKDKDAASFIKEACTLASRHKTDFSLYDIDEDGAVDGIMVICAGLNESETGIADAVWPHQWSLINSGISKHLNGKLIDKYAITSELGYDHSKEDKEDYQILAPIGTFCHEFCHLLGLPDFYDTDNGGSGGESKGLYRSTDIMDFGQYNNYFHTPAGFSALELDILGIGICAGIEEGSYTLEPINKSGTYFRTDSPNPGEYFLFECRDNSEWDKYIGGNGMLVYHIDKSDNISGKYDTFGTLLSAKDAWAKNVLNCNPNHQCARIIAPEEPAASSEDVRMIFFPFGDHTAFTSESSPAFRTWSRQSLNLNLTDIKRTEDGCIEFTTSKGTVPWISEFHADAYQDAVIISWKSSSPTWKGKAVVSFSLESTDISESREVEYQDENGSYCFVMDRLRPGSSYNVGIKFSDNITEGNEFRTNVRTLPLYEHGQAYIFLNSVRDYESGTLPHMARLPLRIFNAFRMDHADWFFNDEPVSIDESGYWQIPASGRLKAVITFKDGTHDTIVKDLRCK